MIPQAQDQSLPLCLEDGHPLVPSRDWALFLDVDGTLVAIADTPSGIRVDPSLPGLLADLTARLDGALALISGRRLADLDRIFSPLVPAAAGLHGLERRDAEGRIHLLGEARQLEDLRDRLQAYAGQHPGVLLEDKGRALAIHYRQAPDLEQEIRRITEELLAKTPGNLRSLHGKMVTEIKPQLADKGSAIAAFLDEVPFKGRRPVFVGDDVTDEDGFAAVNQRGGHSVVVGERPGTRARYQLANTESVRMWLGRLADELRET